MVEGCWYIKKECTNMEEKIVTILNEMAEYLTVPQMKKLQEVILRTFSENEPEKQQISNKEFLKMFLDAKRVEGCIRDRNICFHKQKKKSARLPQMK